MAVYISFEIYEYFPLDRRPIPDTISSNQSADASGKLENSRGTSRTHMHTIVHCIKIGLKASKRVFFRSLFMTLAPNVIPLEHSSIQHKCTPPHNRYDDGFCLQYNRTFYIVNVHAAHLSLALRPTNE